MISVLVPVYNNDIAALVASLRHQAALLPCPAEIVVIDDASREEIKQSNQNVAGSGAVVYEELPCNVGRFKIRQVLASRARYPWLLFIDGDSSIPNNTFLQDYYEALNKGAAVIIGGRIYPRVKPEQCQKMLHWKYGKNREDIVKQKQGFLTNNFCIQKQVFGQLQQPHHCSGYGHEDTWMGMQLDQLGARFLYINNPVVHNEIEDVSIFLGKTGEALENLKMISQTVDEALLARHVRLFRWFCRLRKMKLLKPLVKLVAATESGIVRNLSSCNPSLLLFDLYRLARFAKLMHQPNTER